MSIEYQLYNGRKISVNFGDLERLLAFQTKFDSVADDLAQGITVQNIPSKSFQTGVAAGQLYLEFLELTGAPDLPTGMLDGMFHPGRLMGYAMSGKMYKEIPDATEEQKDTFGETQEYFRNALILFGLYALQLQRRTDADSEQTLSGALANAVEDFLGMVTNQTTTAEQLSPVLKAMNDGPENARNN